MSIEENQKLWEIATEVSNHLINESWFCELFETDIEWIKKIGFGSWMSTIDMCALYFKHCEFAEQHDVAWLKYNDLIACNLTEHYDTILNS